MLTSEYACLQHACGEQLDAYVLQASEMPPGELFDKFRAIVDMYILAGSELEVNIETAMRNKVLKVMVTVTLVMSDQRLPVYQSVVPQTGSRIPLKCLVFTCVELDFTTLGVVLWLDVPVAISYTLNAASLHSSFISDQP